MPKLSQFFGIDIILRPREASHSLPHFHALYGSEQASISIGTLEVLGGRLNRRALTLVLEWAHLHREELYTAWTDLKQGRTPKPIEPLQ